MKFTSKLSGRERTFFFISTVVIVLFLIDHFVFNAIRTEIDDIDNEIAAKRTDITEYNRVLRNKEKIEKETQIYARYLQKEESPELKLQETLNTLAIQSEMTVNELKPVPTREKGKNIAELVSEGKINNLATFLYNLSIMQSIIKVERMELAVRAPKSDILKISLVISQTTVE